MDFLPYIQQRSRKAGDIIKYSSYPVVHPDYPEWFSEHALLLFPHHPEFRIIIDTQFLADALI